MKINELNGYYVKLSTGSITAKDKYGKTCGIVRGVRRLKDAPPREQFGFWDVLRASGLWNAAKSDHCYIDGKTLYWIASKRTEDHYNKLRDDEYFKEESERYFSLIEQAEKSGVRVLHCYL